MEALAGLSLSANILQVVHFTTDLLTNGHNIYQAGSTVQNAELQMVVQDLTVLNNRLKTWARSDPATDGSLDEDFQVRIAIQF